MSRFSRSSVSDYLKDELKLIRLKHVNDLGNPHFGTSFTLGKSMDDSLSEVSVNPVRILSSATHNSSFSTPQMSINFHPNVQQKVTHVISNVLDYSNTVDQ